MKQTRAKRTFKGCNISSPLCGKEECDFCLERSVLCFTGNFIWSKKNKENPLRVSKNSNGKKYWFFCKKCQHHFLSLPVEIKSRIGCSYCGGQKLCVKKECKMCFERSFASSDKSKYWDYEKNIMKPREVCKSTNRKFWFFCEICNHSFQTALSNIRMGHFCSYCASQKLCNDKSCELCLNNSFQSNKRSECWSYEHNFQIKTITRNFKGKNVYEIRDINPRDVFKSTRKKFFFKCDKCNHTFESSLNDISSGKFCPYCGNQKLCNDEDCSFCYNRSFLSHEKSEFWDYEKNKLVPRFVTKKANKKFWFICGECHSSFNISPFSVCNGSFCPFCKRKTEKLFLKYLRDNDIKYIYQPKFEWCRSKTTNRKLPFDFLLEDYKIIIEIDGPQHFRDIHNWRCCKDQVKVDNYKSKLALDNGYTIIRILQDKFYRRPEFYYKEIKEQFYVRENPENVLLGKEALYKNHML